MLFMSGAEQLSIDNDCESSTGVKCVYRRSHDIMNIEHEVRHYGLVDLILSGKDTREFSGIQVSIDGLVDFDFQTNSSRVTQD